MILRHIKAHFNWWATVLPEICDSRIMPVEIRYNGSQQQMGRPNIPGETQYINTVMGWDTNTKYTLKGQFTTSPSTGPTVFKGCTRNELEGGKAGPQCKAVAGFRHLSPGELTGFDTHCWICGEAIDSSQVHLKLQCEHILPIALMLSAFGMVSKAEYIGNRQIVNFDFLKNYWGSHATCNQSKGSDFIFYRRIGNYVRVELRECFMFQCALYYSEWCIQNKVGAAYHNLVICYKALDYYLLTSECGDDDLNLDPKQLNREY